MKHILVFLFLIITYHTIASSPISEIKRDTIFLKNGEIYKVKILTIKNDTVFYHLYSSEQERFFTVAEVKSLNYDDGRVVIPTLNPPSNESIIKLSPEAMFRKGKEDGKQFYRNKTIFWAGATTISLAIFINLAVFLLAPLIVGIISLTRPNLKHILLRDTRIKYSRKSIYSPEQKQAFRDLLNDKNYLAGYQKAARWRKAKSVWLGFFTGIGVILVAIALLIVYFLLIFHF